MGVSGFLFYLAICLILLVMLVFCYFVNSFKFWKKCGVPHLKPSFPFGNMKTFNKSLVLTLTEIYFTMKKSGYSFCGYYMLANPIFMPIDPEIIKRILIADYHFFYDRGFHLDEKNDPMSYSLVTATGKKWKSMREKLSPAFTIGRVKKMFPNILECLKDLYPALNNEIANGKKVNITELTKRLSLDVICSIAFGITGNCLKNPKSEMAHYAALSVSNNLKNSLRISTGIMSPTLLKTFKIQLFNPEATNFFKNVVYQTIEYREQNKYERDDFLNIMLKMKNTEIFEKEIAKNKENKNNINPINIAAQCFVFLLAGYETTATLIKYTLFELAKNEDIQEKLRKEVIKCTNNLSEEITYEKLKEMHYLDNVINESLRKYPPTHMVKRICTKDYRIPNTNAVIPKGTNVVIPTFAIHRDPEYYPDSEKFEPNRFTDEEKEKRPSLTYLPFGDGHRICPGLHFGILEAKMCIVSLICKYKFSNAESICLQSMGSFLSTENPVYIEVEHI